MVFVFTECFLRCLSEMKKPEMKRSLAFGYI
jgi:hypothetical protein